jgi:hypothetical protein
VNNSTTTNPIVRQDRQLSWIPDLKWAQNWHKTLTSFDEFWTIWDNFPRGDPPKNAEKIGVFTIDEECSTVYWRAGGGEVVWPEGGLR